MNKLTKQIDKENEVMKLTFFVLFGRMESIYYQIAMEKYNVRKRNTILVLISLLCLVSFIELLVMIIMIMITSCFDIN